jgi:hypothetical protein
MRVFTIAAILGIALAFSNMEAWAGKGDGGVRTAVSTGPVSSSSTLSAAAGTAGEDWRYQWFEGRWWYWMPDSRWAYYQDHRWNDFVPPGQHSAQAARAAAYETPNRSAVEPAIAERPESRDCPPGGEYGQAASQPADSWSVVGWPARVPGWGVGVH